MEEENKLYDVLAAVFEKDPEEITPDLRLTEDLNDGSAQYFMLMAMLEEEFGKKVRFSRLHKCKTVADLQVMVESL